MATSPKAFDGRFEQILAAEAAKDPYGGWHPNVILMKDTRSERQRTVDIGYARNPRANECRTFTIEQMLDGKQQYAFSSNFVETIDKVWRTEKFLKVEGIAAYYIDSDEEADDLNFNNLYYLAQDYIYEAFGKLFDQIDKEKKQIIANDRRRDRKKKQPTPQQEPIMSQHRDAIPPPPPTTKPEPVEERPAAFDPFEATEENPEPRRAIPPPPDDDAPKSDKILASVLLTPDPVADPRKEEYTTRFEDAKLHVVESPREDPTTPQTNTEKLSARPAPRPLPPEPMRIDEDLLDRNAKVSLLLVCAAMIVTVMFGVWWYETRPSNIAQTVVTTTPTMVAPTIVPAALPVVQDAFPVAGVRLPMSSESLEKYFGQKDPKHYDQSIFSTYPGPVKPHLVCVVDCPENQDGTLNVSRAEIQFR